MPHDLREIPPCSIVIRGRAARGLRCLAEDVQELLRKIIIVAATALGGHGFEVVQDHPVRNCVQPGFSTLRWAGISACRKVPPFSQGMEPSESTRLQKEVV